MIVLHRVSRQNPDIGPAAAGCAGIMRSPSCTTAPERSSPGAVVMVVIRNEVVRPALRRRRLAQLEEENRRLDELLKDRDNQEAQR